MDTKKNFELDDDQLDQVVGGVINVYEAPLTDGLW